MYLSRLMLNSRNGTVRRDLADCQHMHRTVMTAFPSWEGDARTTFGVLHRVETHPETKRVTMLVQSIARPDWADLPKGYLTPGSESEVKAVAEIYAALKEGMGLAFRLRANPTKKVDTKSGPDGTRRNGRRRTLAGEKEQIDWLLRKGASGGFAVLDVHRTLEMDQVGYGDRDVRSLETPRLFFGSVLFEGSIRVTDADRFRKTLAAGIGSGKAYGFGLLSVAPGPRA